MNEYKYVAVGKDRIETRQVNELIGISKGLIADGTINQSEAEFLHSWLATNSDVTNNPVITNLLSRVDTMLADGELDKDEAADLLSTLKGLAGGDFALGEPNKSITTPFDDPAPSIPFSVSTFCFTGTFAYGSRKACSDATISKGGSICGIKQGLNFLVVGEYASDAWKYASFGTKIEKAIAIRNNGHPLAIISESHWAGALSLP
jgi:NAD-dependent DNA ligase